MNEKLKLYRGELFYFTDSPNENNKAYVYEPDGALVVCDGKIVEATSYVVAIRRYPAVECVDYSGKLIMPGLIDAHVHYPQSVMLGMYGNQLLEWLEEYTFPAEQAFGSFDYAMQIASWFVKELIRNGTTTCLAYSTVHATSVEALFMVASLYNMRLLTGKVLMDRNAPGGLKDTIEQGERESRELIERWHGNGRNLYVVTPRFAITSSKEQLDSAGRLHHDYPDTYIQTHLSENKNEIDSVLSLFPGTKDYLEVYERSGLLTDRSFFGHCVHLSESEYRRIAEAGAVMVHCPTSNLFLGSGLFDMPRAFSHHAKVVLGTDVGAGTSFSLFRTMGEAYKVQQLNGYPLPALQTFYQLTLGAAKALHLEDKIGSFDVGHEADFIVVDYASTSAQQLRIAHLERQGKLTLENKLFGLQMLGDDRAVKATYLMGKQVY